MTRLSAESSRVMQLANQEAILLNHEYVGTEHILVALAKNDRCLACHALSSLGASLEKIRSHLKEMGVFQPGPQMISVQRLPRTPRASKVLDYAGEESSSTSDGYIESEHILLGLLREQEGVAAQVLSNLGINFEIVKKQIAKLVGQNEPQPAVESQTHGEMQLDLSDDRKISVVFPSDITEQEIQFLVECIRWTQQQPQLSQENPNP